MMPAWSWKGSSAPIYRFFRSTTRQSAGERLLVGLCSWVWTQHFDLAALIARRFRTGFTFVNTHGAAHLDERAPFGGFNYSAWVE
jgi:acyl-CoA reductase-like NAD-dependent aldehyde dehydrogenase